MPNRIRTLWRISWTVSLSVAMLCGLLRAGREAVGQCAADRRRADAFLARTPDLFPPTPAPNLSVEPTLPPSDVNPEWARLELCDVKLFAMGGIGYGGTIPDGYLALQAVLCQPDARQVFEELAGKVKTDVGRLYVLAGLRRTGSPAYRRLLGRLRSRNAMVKTMEGCCAATKPVRVVAQEIDRGRYDNALAPTRE